MLFDALNQFSDREAIFTGQGEPISYGKVLESGEVLAQCVERRCLVISLCRNTPESVIGYVGFMRAGVVQMLVNADIDPEALLRLVELYQPKYIFKPQDKEQPRVDGRVVQSFGSYDLIALTSAVNHLLHDDLALLLSTSGSTGSPKFVRISYENLAANTASIIQYLGIERDDRAITTMPMSYSYGLSILNTHLARGASLIVTEAPVTNREFWRLLKEFSATTFGGVPYIYEMLSKLRFQRMRLPSLRYLTQAGGRLSAKLATEFHGACSEKNIQFYIMYGQTEATARMSYLPLLEHPEKQNSIGRPIPGAYFHIVDAKGAKISEHGLTGELVYQGENVSMGYATCYADLVLGDVNRGMLRTGDLACQDADGFFYVKGRLNHFLKIFGLRINLRDVEDILGGEGLPCACCGTDERLLVFVTKLDNRREVEAKIAARIGIHRSGFQLIQINEIPRTSSGKIRYKELEDMGSEINAKL